MKVFKFVVAAVAFSVSALALGAGAHREHGQNAKGGEPGNAAEASRTLTVEMHDNYYQPESIEVKPGETVRFVVENKGSLVHEFNIGSPSMHEAHRGEMQMMVNHGVINGDHIDREMMAMDMGNGQSMKHEDPNSVLLEPGETGEIVWKFTDAAELQFACNVPGHYQAGMYGDVRFK